MKKLTKLWALLLVAVVFFAGCKNADDSTGEKLKTATPLFSESETTVEIPGSEIVLSDGNWSFMYIASYEGNYQWEEVEIIVTNKVSEIKSGVLYVAGVIPEDKTKEDVIEFYSGDGVTCVVDGNNFSISMIMDQDDLNSVAGKFAELPGEITSLKTNAERTRYYYTKEEPNSKGGSTTHTYYLMKK